MLACTFLFSRSSNPHEYFLSLAELAVYVGPCALSALSGEFSNCKWCYFLQACIKRQSVVFCCCTTSTATHLKPSHEFNVGCFGWLYTGEFLASVRDRQAIPRYSAHSPTIDFFTHTHLSIYIENLVLENP